ncbi:MAG: RNA polymerase sigma factor RpoD/SigA [Treponema sp.]|jgi:RNA polymerase primary sigma factor|nr:RNA polymerase sigma factor RpoD/SigA [Treponema sp.]
MKAKLEKNSKAEMVVKGKAKAGKKSDENVLAMYLKEINRIPLLTREEEDSIARAAVNGNFEARNKLINGNLRFVVNVAKRYQGHGMPLADLISEGNIGLIKAVERYDADRGFHFISYAVWWIRQTILKALADQSRIIRLPVNRTNDLIQIEKAKKLLAGSTGCETEIRELAQLLSMDESHIEDMLAISRETLSLEKSVDASRNASPLGNFVVDTRYDTPDQAIFKKFLKHDIDEVLSTLSSKEAEIIRYRFGLGQREPMNFQEIGDYFDLSKERIRQIEEKALRLLQQPSRKSKLEAYVA